MESSTWRFLSVGKQAINIDSIERIDLHDPRRITVVLKSVAGPDREIVVDGEGADRLRDALPDITLGFEPESSVDPSVLRAIIMPKIGEEMPNPRPQIDAVDIG